MTKPLRATALAIVAMGVVLGVAWLSDEHLDESIESGRTGNDKADSRLPAESLPWDAGVTRPRERAVRVPIAAPVEADARAFKAFRADLCLFAAARVRAIAAGAGGAPPSAAGRQRALHACEMAASQTSPPSPGLDTALAAFVQTLQDSNQSSAIDKQWRQLASEIGAWRAHTSNVPLEAPESECLARAAFERARTIVSRIAGEAPADWASAGWLQIERARFRESIVALARHGTEHPADAWITIVEPALEAVLRELETPQKGTDHGGANLMRVFLMLIEANQRASSSR